MTNKAIVLYRVRSFWVALGLDSLVLATLLKSKIKVAHRDRTVAHYFAFHFEGTEKELKHLVESVTGLSVVLK